LSPLGFFGSLGAPINVALPIRFPMPNIDIMIELTHAKKCRGIAKWESHRNPIPENSRGQGFIDSGILPFQQKRNVLSVMD
jgi:hypothetical protein